MGKKILHIILSLLFSATVLYINAQELRLGLDYKKNIFSNIDAGGKVELRKSLNYEKHYYSVLQAKASYKFLKYFSVGGSIRYSIIPEIEKSNKEVLYGEMDEKIRYTADFRIKSNRMKNDFRFSNRFRYQQSTENVDEKRSYLRNKTSIDYRLNKQTNPYIAIEPYWYLESGKIKKMRFYIGNEFDFFKDELEIFLILEGNIDGKTISTFHALGLNYKM